MADDVAGLRVIEDDRLAGAVEFDLDAPDELATDIGMAGWLRRRSR
jgi:hypothetical protein